MANETMLRKSEKTALDAETDVDQSWEAAEAASRLVSSVPKVTNVDPLRFLSDVLPLYQCMA